MKLKQKRLRSWPRPWFVPHLWCIEPHCWCHRCLSSAVTSFELSSNFLRSFEMYRNNFTSPGLPCCRLPCELFPLSINRPHLSRVRPTKGWELISLISNVFSCTTTFVVLQIQLVRKFLAYFLYCYPLQLAILYTCRPTFQGNLLFSNLILGSAFGDYVVLIGINLTFTINTGR